MSSNIFTFILFSIISYITTKTKLKDGDNISIIYTEYTINITNFNLSLMNEDAEINDGYSSRIALIENENDEQEIFDLYSKYINRYWLFLVTTEEKANKLLKKDDYTKNEILFNGLLVPKSLNYKIPKDNNNEDVPIFEIDDNTTEILKTLDYRLSQKNIYFIFNIERAISSYPEKYLLYNAITSLCIGITLFTFWRIIMKKIRHAYILPFHKFFNALPFFVNLIGIALIIKALDIRGKNPYQDYDSSVYIDTAVITLNAIYRTLLWFLVLLLAYGWKISIQSLRREDLKFFMKMFLIIYLAMCMDQIIDSIGSEVWVFHYSEIKNLIFYLAILYLLLSKIKIATTFLERKLYYAQSLSPEFVDALRFKLKLVYNHKIMIYTYLPIFLVFVFIHKVFIRPYDSAILELYNYHLIDIYFTIYFMWIFRPQEIPPNFNVDLGNDLEGDPGKIYKNYLPKIEELDKWCANQNKKDLLNSKKKHEPIIVFGPCFDNSKEGINKYIGNMHIAFASDNK